MQPTQTNILLIKFIADQHNFQGIPYWPKTQKAAKCHTYSVTPSYTRVSAHDVISNIAVSEGIINHSAPQ